jgi:hypothetical protein
MRDAVQPKQFILIETEVTRDQPFADRDGSWGTRSTPPSGEGWRIADFGDEHATRWERPRLLPAWGR